MKNIKYALIALALICTLNEISYAQVIDENKLKQHIYYLASDKLEGRSPGTKGEKLAYKYIRKQFKSYGLIPKGEKGFRQEFTYSYNENPHDTTKQTIITKNGTNVVGFLDNGADNTVIIGAHYDHLGLGENSSLDKNKGEIVHNGADDNASGTAGVIELARILAENGKTEESNYLFLCFSAEEDGLRGSKYFTNNPTIDLSDVTYMINMDMIGRLNDSTQNVIISGAGTSPEFGWLFEENYPGLNLVVDSSGIGRSDHTSFYVKDIPVLFFFTGQHMDYHKSTDDADKINYAGVKEVLELISQIIDKLDEKPKLAFTPVKMKQESHARFKVTLGVTPDYAFQGKGLRIDAVSEGRPASKAGLLAGDIVIEMNGKPIGDIYDYMKSLGQFEKGKTTAIKIQRGNEVMSMDVTF